MLGMGDEDEWRDLEGFHLFFILFHSFTLRIYFYASSLSHQNTFFLKGNRRKAPEKAGESSG